MSLLTGRVAATGSILSQPPPRRPLAQSGRLEAAGMRFEQQTRGYALPLRPRQLFPVSPVFAEAGLP